MRTISMIILLLGTIAQAKACFCQCGEEAKYCRCDDPPQLSIKSGTITVRGQTVNLSGKLPAASDRWYYAITCHTGSRLFDFSLWKISQFKDRDGFYEAKSWNLQVSDVKDSPKGSLIYDRENSFYFWGNVDNSKGMARVRVDNIVRLPTEFHGTLSLPEIQSNRERAH